MTRERALLISLAVAGLLLLVTPCFAVRGGDLHLRLSSELRQLGLVFEEQVERGRGPTSTGQTFLRELRAGAGLPPVDVVRFERYRDRRASGLEVLRALTRTGHQRYELRPFLPVPVGTRLRGPLRAVARRGRCDDPIACGLVRDDDDQLHVLRRDATVSMFDLGSAEAQAALAATTDE